MVTQREHAADDDEHGPQRWMGYAEPVQIPCICNANAQYTGPFLDAEGYAISNITPHAALPNSKYGLPAGYSAQAFPPDVPLRWQYPREDEVPMQVCRQMQWGWHLIVLICLQSCHNNAYIT